jgi:hypothetical protein
MSANELFKTTIFDSANLIAYYRLEGNSNDAKNTYNGSDTDISYGTLYGKFNQGAIFNGTSSNIVIPDSALVSGSSDRTVSFWVKIPTIQPQVGERYAFVGWGAASDTNACWIRYSYVSDGVYNIEYGTYGSSGDNPQTYTLEIGGWYFITVTLLSSSSQIYVNASPLGSPYAHTSPNTTAANGRIGCIYTGSNVRFANCYLDDVAIFSRALSSTEISNIYNGNYPQRFNSNSFFNFYNI